MPRAMGIVRASADTWAARLPRFTRAAKCRAKARSGRSLAFAVEGFRHLQMLLQDRQRLLCKSLKRRILS